jgi:polar amino acid transport system permease protein
VDHEQGARPADQAVTATGSRRSRILGGEGGRSLAIATVSTLVFFALIAVAVVTSPGWSAVRSAFFDGGIFADSFPGIASAFLLNVRIFLIAEGIILVFALLIAVLRSLPGPVFFPLRVLAIGYTDLFRGVPTILVIFILGFGAPALQVSGVPISPLFWGIVALVLVYSAYVAEVYRAGIESVHPSQEAAARSLGLNRWQSLQYVILPQAVRRVVPPLLNDFIGLQKDSALVALIGPVEAFRQAQIKEAATFNFTPYLATALLFVLITIPLARFTDWLVARDRRRQLAGRPA